MARRRSKQRAQITMIILSAVVALSLILSLVGPFLIRQPARSTPTPVPLATRPPVVQPTATATETALPSLVGPEQDTQ
jgi:hypothetical protein